MITKKETLTLIMNSRKYTYEIETIDGKIEDIALTYSVDSPLFQYMENIFFDWFEGQRSETQAMYESDEAIYYKKGAIRGAIEILDEHIRENNLRYLNLDKEGYKIDIECAFE